MKPSAAGGLRLTTLVSSAGCAAKVGPGVLREALAGLPRGRRDRRVLVDQTTLDDAGVFAYGRGEALVQTVDFFTPIVDDPYDFGQVAAANALSDVYAMGGTPLTALALVCYPDAAVPPEALREILRGGLDKVREAGAVVLGGHSVRDPELKFGYSVTGVVKRRQLLTNAGARPGDVLLLTKPLGTGVLSTALKQERLDAAAIKRLTRSMAALNRAASECGVAYGARAATDVTGFSLMGHAQQMADASGVSMRLHPSREWLMPRVLDLIGEGVEPGGLGRNLAFYGKRNAHGETPEPLVRALYDPQTSGGLLLAVPPRRATALRTALTRARVWVAEVGRVVPRVEAVIQLTAA
jgi:selenide,water dikinase